MTWRVVSGLFGEGSDEKATDEQRIVAARQVIDFQAQADDAAARLIERANLPDQGQQQTHAIQCKRVQIKASSRFPCRMRPPISL